MDIVIQGAGIAGCAAAITFAEAGHTVYVVDRRSELSTEGAGILLYSNALTSLRFLGVYEEVIGAGFCMEGKTAFLDSKSNLLGTIQYPSVTKGIPAYCGVERFTLLKILYDKARSLGAQFSFNTTVSSISQTSPIVHGTFASVTGNRTFSANLLIAADGVKSSIRKQLLPDVPPTYSGYSLWHSMHEKPLNLVDKLVGASGGVRMGLIPLSNNRMYMWASKAEPEKVKLSPSDWASELKNTFRFSGFLGDVIDSVDSSTYVHYTSVDEVRKTPPWHVGRVVFIGDAAHASLPFMAQGGAQALHDVVSLKLMLNRDDVENSLAYFARFRAPVVKHVQDLSSKIGESYGSQTVDLAAASRGLSAFYANQSHFHYSPN